MNRSVGITSALLGLALTLAVPVGPAAAGRDSVDKTAATNTQGRSQSDPDGLSNGGADKPGHTGGFTDDRDGNNGCGNDDDREDDNNGRCGGRSEKKAKAAKPAEAAAASSPVTASASAAGSNVAVAVLAGSSHPLAPVSGSAPATQAADAASPASDPSGAEVLGAQEERDSSSGPASLPRTGAGLLIPALVGAALAGAGATLRRFSRG